MARIHARYGQPAVYNASVFTLNDGDSAGLSVDANGNLRVTGAIGGGGGVSAVYNVAPPTYTNGQTATLQTDANGNLKVVSSGASGYTELATTAPGVGGLSLGRFKATAPALTDGQMYGLQLDAAGNLRENMATRLDAVNDAITSYDFGHAYTHIITNTTTIVKSGSGFLRSIKVNNPSLITVANLTITVYDNTAASGNVIGVFTVPFGQAGAMPFNIDCATAFNTGCTIVTAGPTVPGDLTIESR